MTPDWLADVRPGLASALRDCLPELEWIDRDLELEDGRRVDVVGVDGGGRATALVLVGDDEEAALLVALDAHAWFARHRSLLDGHFGHPRLDPSRTPRVLLIAEVYSDRMLARLAGLDPAVVQAFELRHVTSQRNARAYLVPARPAPLADAPDDPTGARALLRGLGPEPADLAERMLRRLERADDELDLAADGAGVRCTLDGEALCGLQARRGTLLGWVGEGDPEPLQNAEDGEVWIERVLRELRRLLPAGAQPTGGEGSPGSGAEAVSVDPFDPAAPLLTPEEISAFQDP
ncbi:MAG TPA: hypothetical protein VMT18_10410 [Planctomycetota bacterium]|nr:hypothetical protein [Planctomycetota bacterium]